MKEHKKRFEGRKEQLKSEKVIGFLMETTNQTTYKSSHPITLHYLIH